MTQGPILPAAGAKPKGIHWRRMVTVWVLLALAMSVVALIAWAALPRTGPPEEPDSVTALKATLWPKGMAPNRPWRFIVLHHSAAPSGTVETLDPQRLDGGASYHIVINNGVAPGTVDGGITSTARWIEQQDGPHGPGAEASPFAADGIDICLVGDFDRDRPTVTQMVALEVLVNLLRDRYNIPLEMVVCHWELHRTHCPGVQFPMEQFVLSLRQTALVKRMRLAPAETP
jgi:hypothetical protein